MTRPDWVWQLNPLGKVPILLHKVTDPTLPILQGLVIYESLVTCEWVEEALPGRRLHSEDPGQRARDRMLTELFNKVTIFTQTKASTNRSAHTYVRAMNK